MCVYGHDDHPDEPASEPPEHVVLLAANPWAMATLYDAYFGFITFFCWLAWRERSLGIKLVWFVLIMGLGNMALSLYVVLVQLFGLKAEEGVEALFRKKAA